MRIQSGGKINAYVTLVVDELHVQLPRLRALETRLWQGADPNAHAELQSQSSCARGTAVPQRGTVQLEARGPAVYKAVTVAEIAKRRVFGLHQNTQIGLAVTGSGSVQSVPMITITLSAQPLDPSIPGYQSPLKQEEFTALAAEAAPPA